MPQKPSRRLAGRSAVLCAALLVLVSLAAGCSGGSRCPTCPRHTEPARASIQR